MNLTVFPVGTTNIFPIANSTAGGQLVTEYNLRSRESVLSNEDIEYFCGQSFTHGESDFYVRYQASNESFFDNSEDTLNSSTIEILAGRAVVNGHYIELLEPIMIDLQELNAQLADDNLTTLKGELSIGLRVMYSTEQTMAGSMLIENDDDMYEGIQVVILPRTEFITPEDSPSDETKVTAHIKLADFTFINNTINHVVNNYPDKCAAYDAVRIKNIEDIVDDICIRKTGLNTKKLYVFAGKGVDPSTGKDTWCEANDSMMIWDSTPTLTTTKPTVTEACFQTLSDGSIQLCMPHKQVDYNIHDTSGTTQYYASKTLSIPTASFNSNTAGTVTPAYTKSVKAVLDKINTLYNLPSGSQRAYIDTLESVDDLPEINTAWSAGDYILVKEDKTIATTNVNSTYPSTLYVVLPGFVYSTTNYGTIYDFDGFPEGVELATASALPTGVKIGNYYFSENSVWGNMGTYRGVIGADYFSSKIDVSDLDKPYGTVKSIVNVGKLTATDVSIEIGGSVLFQTSDEQTVSERLSELAEEYSDIAKGTTLKSANYTSSSLPSAIGSAYSGTEVFGNLIEHGGIQGVDYFTMNWRSSTSGTYEAYAYVVYEVSQKTSETYYFVVHSSGTKSYSDPIRITSSLQLAEEDTVGGFLNVPDTATDYGYVIRDDEGHLQLLDYSLLRTGVLAYQLGQDITVPTGTIEEIQTYLNEYVNQRVAFPNATQTANVTNPNVININITLAEATEDEISAKATSLYLYDIDCRFNTSICLNILGTATSTTTINIIDCEKIRINSSISGTPIINLYRSNLYYNTTVLNYLSTIEDLKLWYEKFEDTDPNLVVNDLTVREVDSPIVGYSVDFWDSTAAPNDNHFTYAIQSITFGSDGVITGCDLLIRNDMTSNVQLGQYIITGEFSIPQGTSLTYPITRLNKTIKTTGTFVAAYYSSSSEGYIVQETNFTAVSQTYDSESGDSTATGYISFLINSSLVETTKVSAGTGVTPPETIDGWESNSFHVFSGHTIS